MPSDVIRFTQTGGPNHDTLGFYFFSADGGSLADSVLPQTLSGNSITLLEGADYIPNAGDPGFVSGFDTGYTFTSETPALTDKASTIVLLSATILTLVKFCRNLREPL
jgi:hypothetical protein